jgi:ATP-dependent helicase/nuclease subunit A
MELERVKPTRKLFTPTVEQKKAANPEHSVWVSANAGSGKTHVLVDRLIRLLLSGAEPSQVLSITFTKAAAAEMANRVFERLSGWAILSDKDLRAHLEALGVNSWWDGTLARARRLFALALETPGGLKIQTIHAFCQNLLHLFPVEAGLAPGFEILDEPGTHHLMQQAWLETLARLRQDPDGQIAASFNRIERFFSEDRFDDAIRDILQRPGAAAKQVAETLDYDVARQLASIALSLDPAQNEQSVLLAVAAIDAKSIKSNVAALVALRSNKKTTQDTCDILLGIINEPDSVIRMQLIRKLLTTDKQKRKTYITGSDADRAPAAASAVETLIDQLIDCATLHDAHRRATLSADLLFMSGNVLSAYQRLKLARGAFDFNDLIDRTAHMLRQGKAAQWVLYKLDRGIEHILVDEAQDTSEAQWSIILALAAEFFAGQGTRDGKPSRTLFVVGDQKQSIYSFQGADAALFEAQHNFVANLVRAATDFSDVKLQLSYRTVGDILKVVDTVFTPDDLTALGIARAGQDNDAHEPSRRNDRGVFELWPPLARLEEEQPMPWHAPVDVEKPGAPRPRLAREIARLIKSWIGHRVIAATGKTVDPGDIIILLRRRGDLFGLLIAALRREGVPVAGADRLRLRESLAVQDLLSLAQFMLLPDDDHSLACILKSPLIAESFDDKALFQIAHARRGTLWAALQSAASPQAEAAVTELAGLRELAAHASPYVFFAHVMGERRKAIAARLGPEAVDATKSFLDLAMNYERSKPASLAGFVAWFSSEDIVIQREMDKPKGEVRIMTVHGAKGLEAPIVIIPEATDTGANRSRGYIDADGVPVLTSSELLLDPATDAIKSNASLHDKQEYMRMLYVAMTRAKDELYVFGALTGDTIPKDSWYAHIERARAASPLLAMRPVGVVFDGLPAIVHRFGVDPKWVTKPSEQSKPEDPLPAWAIPAPARPPMQREEKFVGSTTGERDPAKRRGIAIHTLLQHLAGLEDQHSKAAAARLGDALDLSHEDRDKVLAIFEREDLAPFFGANSEGEVELAYPTGDMAAEPLRIDRLVVTPDAVLVLDYKTGKPEPLSPDHPYTQQLGRYADTLSEYYPGRVVKPALLWIDSGQLEWVNLSQARDLPSPEHNPDPT